MEELCRLDEIIRSRSEREAWVLKQQFQKIQCFIFSRFSKKVQPEDLVKYGLIPEFVGRLPVTATLEELDEESLIMILTEPKNSLMKQFKKLFSMENVDLEIRDDALLEIAKKAIERKSGARGLRSIMENILLDLMYDIPSDQNIEKVVLDSSSVSGESDPLVVYSQSEAPKKALTKAIVFYKTLLI